MVLYPRSVRWAAWMTECVGAATASGEAMPVASVGGEIEGLSKWDESDERIAACDFALAFEGGRALPYSPRLGLWMLRLGGLAWGCGEHLGLRELVAKRCTISVEWVAGSRVLHSAWLLTRYTPRRTRRAVFEAAPRVLVGAVRRANRASLPQVAGVAAAAWPRRPSRAHTAAAWTADVLRRARARIERETWAIGVARMTVPQLLAGSPVPEPAWSGTAEPGGFVADPFPFAVGGRDYVLFERWCRAKGRGEIAVAALDGNGRLAKTRTAIDLGCHMSYPFVFEYDGAVWCLPEVSGAGSQLILRMGHSPTDWSRHTATFPPEPLLDATLVEHDERWWLLAGVAGRRRLGELHAWHARLPLGPWTPHPLNPIKTDIGSARPGGALFRAGGDLYRPGQDCSETYGRAIVLHKILRLDPDGFEEVVVRRVEAGAEWPWRDGLHTLNVIDGRIVLDAKRLAVFQTSRSK